MILSRTGIYGHVISEHRIKTPNNVQSRYQGQLSQCAVRCEIHALSAGAEGAYSVEAMADAVAALLQQLGDARSARRQVRWHLIGYSLGARIALRLALRHGRVSDTPHAYLKVP